MRTQKARKLWRYAGGFAFAGLLCAVLLGGLSAWFLGSVALAGLSAAAYTFNFHMPGALVRLFALGRTAARYGERLTGHQAALTDQTGRRIALFDAMAAAPAVRGAGWQLADQARLADYLDDVEDLDFARLRADLPAMLLVAGLAGSIVATVFIAPLALIPIMVLLAALCVALRRLLGRGEALWRQVREGRREGARELGAILGSVVPLQAERVWPAHGAAALRRFSQADDHLLALRRAQAWSDALASLLGPLAAVSVMAAAWIAGARTEALLIPVFLAFSWLALGEAAQGISRMAVAALRRRVAAAEIARWTEATPAAASPAAPQRLVALESRALQRCAPDGRPLAQPLALVLKAGSPTILVGASGVGKTSLLKQIAGWIGDDVLESEGEALSAAARRALAMFCPHDAAILADSIRANLFAPERPDSELWQALDAVELTDRVQEAGGLDGWITQDAVSLGEAQRLNLARAWLTRKPLVLLDEPTEHLDAEQGPRILARLMTRLRDRIVVMSSHGTVASGEARILRLD